LLYDYLSSNAYSDVIPRRKDGWFGRSTMFNPSDLTDLAAELVLIDPNTRALLQPTSMPDSGRDFTIACKASSGLQSISTSPIDTTALHRSGSEQMENLPLAFPASA
jgi:hypothetical protein